MSLMKLRSSSSGCKSRPARGEPAQVGSEPGDGPGNAIGEAEAREHVGRGICSHENYGVPGAQGVVLPEGKSGLRARGKAGEGRLAPGGVFDHGTPEEDGPGPWEALVAPWEGSGVTETR